MSVGWRLASSPFATPTHRDKDGHTYNNNGFTFATSATSTSFYNANTNPSALPAIVPRPVTPATPAITITTVPTPATLPRHSHKCALVGERVFYFGGRVTTTIEGHAASSVLSTDLLVQDKSLNWKKPDTHGTPPCAREEHAMAAVGVGTSLPSPISYLRSMSFTCFVFVEKCLCYGWIQWNVITQRFIHPQYR
jgi:hypothetical protein